MDPKSRGLGRGLNALFEDDEEGVAASPGAAPVEGAPAAEGSAKGRMMMGIEKIHPGRLQPRQVFDEEALGELAASIRAHGLLQPLLVREDSEKPGMYEIIAGERRWRAAQKAQLHEVPVNVLTLDDAKVLEVGLVENLQREDLNPVEEARGYKKLTEDYGHTQEKLAEILGKSRPHVANMMRLLGLPDKVLGFLEKGEISAGHARALLTSKDALATAKKVISQGLSVRQTEALVAKEAGRPEKKKSGSSASATAKDADTIALEEELSSFLGMRVTISPTGDGAGTVQVAYKTLDQLDDVVHRLTQVSKVAGRLME